MIITVPVLRADARGALVRYNGRTAWLPLPNVNSQSQLLDTDHWRLVQRTHGPMLVRAKR